MSCLTHCADCNESKKLSKCSRCKLVAYCSKGCQRKHWKLHKVECAPPPSPSPTNHGHCSVYHMWSSPFLRDPQKPELQLETTREWEIIEKVLKNSNMKFEIRSAPATIPELKFNAFKATIFHFSGHGFKKAKEINDYVGFEHACEPYDESKANKLGMMLMLSSQDIKDVHKKFNPLLVVVMACHSESVGNAFREIGVRHVVAIKRCFCFVLFFFSFFVVVCHHFLSTCWS
jgi:hypothetical protein